MTIEDIKNKVGISGTTRLIGERELKDCEKEIGLDFGIQLKDYILKYGYLTYKFVELYGINSNQGLDSDMITQTKYLHKYYPITKELIAIENQGEGDYYWVNSKDKMFEYDTHLDELLPMDMTLNEYIITRFESLG